MKNRKRKYILKIIFFIYFCISEQIVENDKIKSDRLFVLANLRI